jgi:hypothetical protein
MRLIHQLSGLQISYYLAEELYDASLTLRDRGDILDTFAEAARVRLGDVLGTYFSSSVVPLSELSILWSLFALRGGREEKIQPGENGFAKIRTYVVVDASEPSVIEELAAQD